MDWFANIGRQVEGAVKKEVNSVVSTGRKLYNNVAKIGEKTVNTVRAGQKLVNDVVDVVKDPASISWKKVGNVVDDGASVIGSGSDVLSAVDQTGSNLFGDFAWGMSPGSALGFLGRVGQVSAKSGHLAGKGMKGERVTRDDVQGVIHDGAAVGLEYGLSRLTGGLAKRMPGVGKTLSKSSRTGKVPTVMGTYPSRPGNVAGRVATDLEQRLAKAEIGQVFKNI